MREVEEEVAKNSILLYDKDEVQNITSLEQEVKEMCQCKVDHLPAIEGFILHYPDGNHLPATKFLSIKGIVLADEDHVVAPPDDEIDEEERMIPLVRILFQTMSNINLTSMNISNFSRMKDKMEPLMTNTIVLNGHLETMLAT